MDIGLYARVISRFRLLVASGFLLAVALTIMAIASVSFKGGMPRLTYRTPAIWQSQSSLLITQQGFPWGRSNVSPTTDPSRFTNLVGLYAKLVNSDAVQSRLHLKQHEAVKAQPVLDTSIFGSSTPLPILSILGAASTPAHARALASRATIVFRRYMDENQKAAAIPADQRIVLQVINRAPAAVLLQGHKKTIPMLVFITVLLATLGLAFILENLRPSIGVLPASEGRELKLRKKSA